MYDLTRFRTMQDKYYKTALEEVRSGRKRTHWIWYIFPQLRGLGRSSTSEYYGIENLDEAKAYLSDPELHANLIHISQALLDLECSDPRAVMGYPDDLKLCSSMTLFSEADPTELVFQQVLTKFFAGFPDERTIELLYRKG